MSRLSRQDARDFIDNLRIENGGLTEIDIDFLKRERPHIWTSVDSLRRKLGASAVCKQSFPHVWQG
jgi:hypothetical protein